MDLNALKSFVMVAEALNFTKVAERRNTVQSAISSHVTKLESELDRTLIIRGRGQSMSLTPEGEALAVYARRLLSLAHEARETIQTSRSRRIVRLGTTVTLAMSIVSDVLAAYATERTNVQIHIQCDRSEALLSRLGANEIDIAFMMDQGEPKNRAFVHSQPLAWVSGENFQLRSSDDVPLAFLSDGRDLRRYALEALDTVGRKGHVSHLSPHPIGVRAFVQAGLALTIMPMLCLSPPLQIASTDLNLPPLSQVALSAYTKSPHNQDINLLIEMLKKRLM
ncbi:LysR family transcriptional regulator [Kiloniella litopenaei]|nr:LysR family transcriptional regulator [Kiloniella litopenaei]